MRRTRLKIALLGGASVLLAAWTLLCTAVAHRGGYLTAPLRSFGPYYALELSVGTRIPLGFKIGRAHV